MSDDLKNSGNWNTGYLNTGHRNTGHYNTGHYNTGDYNTRDYNTRDYNTGDRNAGNYNTGDCNTGQWNTGDWNTGDCNTGRWNTGDCNTGDCNTGDWNAASRHVGCFNTVDPEKAYYFNKLLDVAEWDDAEKPGWIYDPRPTEWVLADTMTDQEKAENPEHETTGGYLRVNDMKEEWARAYVKATPEEIALTKAMPGFDADVFLEITGIDLREPKPATCDEREIVIDGVTYILKRKE